MMQVLFFFVFVIYQVINLSKSEIIELYLIERVNFHDDYEQLIWARGDLAMGHFIRWSFLLLQPSYSGAVVFKCKQDDFKQSEGLFFSLLPRYHSDRAQQSKDYHHLLCAK
ncbi:hypothetical protein CF651_07070 [Paenibacillus rigui]|uniref:Uncharacterized protein n=1 Tax=Paenibacillus rigui TaxID=554312 RepID=A0A229UUI8_9BACL|nr:hypothetical protein CF651_07070 [Paenibacillus rigui]